MMTILRIIDHIHSKFDINEQDKTQMPKWMYELHSKFIPSEHINILLFILKIIINKSEIFEPYCNYWYKNIIKLVISGMIGDTFHYYLRDICILLLKWNIIPKENSEEKNIFSSFMNHLIKNIVYTNSKDVIKSNLTLFKLFTEKWKGKFSPSKKIIIEMLSHEGTGRSTNVYRISALQIIDILVQNNFSLFETSDTEVSEFKWITALVNNLVFPAKEVYQAAAEVCGLALEKIYSDDENSAKSSNVLEQMVKDKINNMFAKNEFDRVLNALVTMGNR